MSWLRSWQAYLQGKEEGEAEATHKSAAQAAETSAEAKEIRNEVEALPPDELRRRASRWVRGAAKDDSAPKG